MTLLYFLFPFIPGVGDANHLKFHVLARHEEPCVQSLFTKLLLSIIILKAGYKRSIITCKLQHFLKIEAVQLLYSSSFLANKDDGNLVLLYFPRYTTSQVAK